MKHEARLKNEGETIRFGMILGEFLLGGGRVYIKGSLGAGKTTLCRGVLRTFGFSGAVKSPTFTLIEPYELSSGTIYHFDLYRLSDPDELEYIGLDEYFQHGNLCLVEWPEQAGQKLPAADLEIELILKDKARQIILKPKSSKGKDICNNALTAWSKNRGHSECKTFYEYEES